MTQLLTADQIDARRKAAGLTRAQLYERARIAHTTFIRWKTGRTRPTIAVYERLVAAIERAEREPVALIDPGRTDHAQLNKLGFGK